MYISVRMDTDGCLTSSRCSHSIILITNSFTRSETLSQTSISAGEGVDLTVDVFSIDGFGFF